MKLPAAGSEAMASTLNSGATRLHAAGNRVATRVGAQTASPAAIGNRNSAANASARTIRTGRSSGRARTTAGIITAPTCPPTYTAGNCARLKAMP